MSKVKIVQDENEPVAPEVIAKAITAIADGIRRLRQSPLTDGALYLLIQHSCGSINGQRKPTIREIKTVIEGLESLDKRCLKPKKK